MKDKTDLWMKLCVEAAIERNPHEFLKIKKQICQLLKAKEQRLGLIESKPGSC